mgnify:FL=1
MLKITISVTEVLGQDRNQVVGVVAALMHSLIGAKLLLGSLCWSRIGTALVYIYGL